MHIAYTLNMISEKKKPESKSPLPHNEYMIYHDA